MAGIISRLEDKLHLLQLVPEDFTCTCSGALKVKGVAVSAMTSVSRWLNPSIAVFAFRYDDRGLCLGLRLGKYRVDDGGRGNRDRFLPGHIPAFTDGDGLQLAGDAILFLRLTAFIRRSFSDLDRRRDFVVPDNLENFDLPSQD